MASPNPFIIRPVSQIDQSWVIQILTERWASPIIVTRGVIHHADQLPGFVAERGGRRIGLVTYYIHSKQCEIVSLDSLEERIGIGTSLLAAVQSLANQAECIRLWLITTNDNLPALGFYQKRGFRLVAVHRDTLELSRKLKPEISRIGVDGIPILDEIELEIIFPHESGLFSISS